MLSLRKFLNKKIVLVFVIFLILIVGGLFFWWQIDEIDSFIERKKIEKMVAPSKDYSMIENYDGEFIINEKDRLKIKIPAGWEVGVNEDMEILESSREVILYSKNFSYRPPEGCSITIQVNRLQRTPIEKYKEGRSFIMYLFEGAEEIKEMIGSYKESTLEEKESMQKKGIEIILIDQRDALKEVVFSNEDVGRYITVKIPTDNRLYVFGSMQLSETCNKEFDEFLRTISINPD
ncbi:MAG: hypothetical protein WC514_02780 [Candidatus Paceibacterota bacterium]